MLHNSINLNPAIMYTIEVEMVYDSPETAESELAVGIQSLLAKQVIREGVLSGRFVGGAGRINSFY